MVRWNDNSNVTLAYNHYGFEPVAQTKPWSNIDKKFVEIDQPYTVVQYNKFMGGADRMDRNISQYRYSIRPKKWWWLLRWVFFMLRNINLKCKHQSKMHGYSTDYVLQITATKWIS
ncbi:DDE_Tnp_1_7 domain-containing protein [Nephila pilipes]|uniref:DDE_Tnp_1_7 domain-containing protein n=1 Tax=Nephila pilipes TaxID=299642 RepID=A0A8X6JSW8_NEPPI|nr:DDE_Tnp_1_7 domain-containing protein [Nephila pilipes]